MPLGRRALDYSHAPPSSVQLGRPVPVHGVRRDDDLRRPDAFRYALPPAFLVPKPVYAMFSVQLANVALRCHLCCRGVLGLDMVAELGAASSRLYGSRSFRFARCSAAASDQKLAMPRPQFTLRALLVAMLAAFFGGMAVQRHVGTPVIHHGALLGSMGSASGVDTLTLPDGTLWFRPVYRGRPQGMHTFEGEHGEKITIEANPKRR